MIILPASIMARLDAFAPIFSPRVWRHVPTLVGRAILAPGRRMVSSTLRVMGLGRCAAFSTYHRVLNRDVWSSLHASRILLGLLVAAFAPTGPLVVGIDATLERRRGPKISAAGIYRDPVRSSHSHFVKVRALRWVSMMLLVPIPWAHWTWALPFLTVLAPSDRYDEKRAQRHKSVPRWAQQMILQLHRWYPDRALVVVGDQDYAVIELLAATRLVATIVTRLRLDARLFEPAPPRPPHQKGRPRVVGPRLPTLAARAADPTTAWTALTVVRWYGEDQRDIEIVSGTAVWYHGGKPPVPIRWVLIRDPRGAFPTQALLCTNLDATPEQIVAWFGMRQDSESVMVDSQSIGYPSPFIEVRGGGDDGLSVLPGGRDTGTGPRDGVGLSPVPLPSLSAHLQRADGHPLQPPAGPHRHRSARGAVAVTLQTQPA